ncbi:hypothetical protein [Kitasatospora phosalacinea]|uniref:Uncharacterized protein n=1 Tax=Kitasatospora phosalacinea TaxID=2065 RepID=A0A9W6PE55_9ACTN|nr:hypothetical protein [Kitasatospora phosalacinea]GLW53283.1 hypothetical protein Kpho01_12940 [Kitasatospora phosalacinea]
MNVPVPSQSARDGASALSCFVIGPIGDRHRDCGSPERLAYEEALEVYEKVVLPACGSVGLEPTRADLIAQPGEITEQVCRHVMHADVVVADVTGGNPNVMYELGIRHLLGRPTVQLGEHGRLPFDISLIRTIQFKRTRGGLVDARKELEQALRSGLRDGFGIPTPARVLNGTEPREPADPGAGTADLADPDDPDAPGLFERFAAVEADMEVMGEDMNAMTRSINDLAEVMEQFGPQIQSAWGTGTPLSANLAVTKRMAAALAAPAGELRVRADRFASHMERIDQAVGSALDLLQRSPEFGDVLGADAFVNDLVGVAVSIREGLAVMEQFRALLAVLAGMSMSLRQPVREIARAIDRLGEVVARAESWERRGTAMLRERVARTA